MTPILVAEGAASHAPDRHGIVPLHQLVDGIARVQDLGIVMLAGIAAHWALPGMSGFDQQASIAMAIALLLGANLFAVFKLYDPVRLGSLMYQLPRVFGAWCGTMGGMLVVIFMLGMSDELSRLWVLVWFAIGGALLVSSRCGLKAWIESAQRRGELTRNVLVIDTSDGTHTPSEELVRQERATRIVGRLDISLLMDPNADDRLSASGAQLLRQWLLTRRVDHVAIALPAEHQATLAALLAALRHFPVEVGLIPQLPAGGVPVLGVKQIGAIPSIMLLEKPLDGWRSVTKAVWDRVLAFFILLAIAPLMVGIALAVRLTSPGPVFFRQKRHGFNQQMIDVFKFRTMYVEACDAPLSDRIVQARRDDSRITPIGRFLRRTSLDELPQLLNVLRGEMSLVGPRPHPVALDRYYAELIDGYLGRHRVKPGITGWAQVNGFRGETQALDDMRQRIEYDLFYIDHWSLLFDIRIIFRTLFVGFAHSKAY
jgi:putative colanic acid biosynthesis UDP-glucose lipid carrier transferase